MAEPIFGVSTERAWARIPEHYRTSDAALEWPFKAYASALLDQVSELEELIDRLDYRSPTELEAAGDPVAADTSDLVDPATAEPDWLAWLAQLVGVDLAAQDVTDVAARRNAVGFAGAGWLAGTRPGIAGAAAAELTGTKYVRVVPHTDDGPNLGEATWEHVSIITRPTETPDPAAIVPAVIAARAKPAGVELHHRTYEASWAAITAEYPTWAALQAAGSWQAIQEAGI